MRVASTVFTLGTLMGAGSLLVVSSLFMGVTGGTSDDTSDTALASAVTTCTLTGGGDVEGMSEDQLANAKTILEVGTSRGVPARGLVVAIATALQESGLRNLPGGDRDSAGLFQQRPSSGWGSWTQITDPVYAATAFYGGADVPPANPGLLDVAGWEQMSVTGGAQRVQRSAFPNAYARHEARAAAIVQSFTGDAPPACAPLTAGPWTLPIASGSYRLTSGFGSRLHPIRHTLDFHTGLDFAAPAGTIVRAVSDGKVITVGPGGGYGTLMKVKHSNGVESWYAHLSATNVSAGQAVSVGQPIAAVGSTGNSTGPHLHLEVRVDGKPTDPTPWLRSKGLRL